MRLVWRHSGDDLYGANQPRTVIRGKQDALPAFHSIQHFVEKLLGIALRERPHETDRSASFDAVNQNCRQGGSFLTRLCRVQVPDVNHLNRII